MLSGSFTVGLFQMAQRHVPSVILINNALRVHSCSFSKYLPPLFRNNGIERGGSGMMDGLFLEGDCFFCCCCVVSAAYGLIRQPAIGGGPHRSIDRESMMETHKKRKWIEILVKCLESRSAH